MLVELVQFVRPEGRPVDGHYDVSDDVAAAYEALRAEGLRLTAEVLTTGEVSWAVEDVILGDFDCVVGPNDGTNRRRLETLIGRFDTDAYWRWAAMVDAGGPDA